MVVHASRSTAISGHFSKPLGTPYAPDLDSKNKHSSSSSQLTIPLLAIIYLLFLSASKNDLEMCFSDGWLKGDHPRSRSQAANWGT